MSNVYQALISSQYVFLSYIQCLGLHVGFADFEWILFLYRDFGCFQTLDDEFTHQWKSSPCCPPDTLNSIITQVVFILRFICCVSWRVCCCTNAVLSVFLSSGLHPDLFSFLHSILSQSGHISIFPSRLFTYLGPPYLFLFLSPGLADGLWWMGVQDTHFSTLWLTEAEGEGEDYCSTHRRRAGVDFEPHLRSVTIHVTFLQTKARTTLNS